MFKRPIGKEAGSVPAEVRGGDGWLAMPRPVAQAADSAQVISAAAFAQGLYYRSGLTVGRTDTTDTAVNILNAVAGLDVGEAIVFAISNQSAQILTIGAGAGVTLVGKGTVPASGFSWFLLTRTGAATVSLTGL